MPKLNITELIYELKCVHSEESARRFVRNYADFANVDSTTSMGKTVCSRGITYLIEKHFTRVGALNMKKYFEFFFSPAAHARLQEH